MRLKSGYISQYKNLKDFTLSFDGNSFIDVFVGKNGTRKSQRTSSGLRWVEIYLSILGKKTSD
jgi:hypothetical protein